MLIGILFVFSFSILILAFIVYSFTYSWNNSELFRIAVDAFLILMTAFFKALSLSTDGLKFVVDAFSGLSSDVAKILCDGLKSGIKNISRLKNLGENEGGKIVRGADKIVHGIGGIVDKFKL